ncbi:flagellar assembly protein FliH [Shewanella sp. A14]
MPESKSPKNILNADAEHEFSHWQLPDITKDSSQDPSNLFGKFTAHTPTTATTTTSDKPMAPPTMAQIEDIRAAAEQEGFEQGKQDGYQQGVEQGRLEGLEQGHQEGFTQGEQQGLEAGQTKANELVAQLSQIMSQFEQPLLILDNEIEAELLAMTISLAKAVIGHELKTHPEHILTALRQGVDSLPLKEQLVKLRLNQADAELVNQFYSTEQLQKNQWQIDIDPSLSNGDCMIESVRSSVDLRVEQRINQVFSELDAQSNQLTKSVQQQKSTQSQYQTTSVDKLSEYQLTPSTTDNIDVSNHTDSSHNNSNVQTNITESDDVMSNPIDASSTAVDINAPADKSADETSAAQVDHSENNQPQMKDISQGNTDEHPSTSTT